MSSISMTVSQKAAQPEALMVVTGAKADTSPTHKPSSEFLDRPEGRIAYDDVGQGPVVILVPGLGDVRAEYRFLTPLLVRSGYRVLAMDLRGHGQSSTGWPDYTSSAIGSDIVALARHVNAGPVILAGTSMGAAAVAWAAAEAPDLVSRLILIGPFVRDIPPKSRLAGFMAKTMIRVALAGPWALWAWGAAYGSFYKNKPADFAAYRKALVANMAEPGRLQALKAMAAASKDDVARRLHEISATSLVVMGGADPDFPDPRKEAETVAGLVRGVYRMIDDTGHYPHVEKPAEVAALLKAFIDRPEGF